MQRIVSGLVLFAVLLAGCMDGSTGRLRAGAVGALIEPPITRESRLETLREACGEPGSVGGGLVRRPYVQSIDAVSALVRWTSTANAEQLVVWPADGERRAVQPSDDATVELKSAVQRTARLTDLEPATTYCYEVRSGEEVVFGPVGFRTAPLADADAPVDLLVFGDSGTGSPDQFELEKQMETVPVDLILHTGDVAYPAGTLAQFENEVFRVYRDLFASVPFYPSIGNHDDTTASARPLREAFELPGNGGSADALERRYSFDWGPVHFVALDTNRTTDEHAQWLERDLAANQRPWVVVFGHHPPYSAGEHGSSTSFRDRFGPILARHGVQLVLSGHDHHYERSHAIDGVTYVVTGGGGAETRPVGYREWTAFSQEVVHLVSLRIEGGSLRGYAVDGTGEVFDSFVIER